MDTDYQTVLELISTLQERHSATVIALERAAEERQALRDALTNESRLCDLRGEDLARLRERLADAQVSRAAVEELQKNYDARGEELEAMGIELAHLRRMRETDEEWTRDDTILCMREKASADIVDAIGLRDHTIKQLRAQLARAQEHAEELLKQRNQAVDARIAIIGALGICGESWMPMTGDGPKAVRCTQVCSLPVGHKGAHGWGRNVQAATVQATKDPT